MKGVYSAIMIVGLLFFVEVIMASPPQRLIIYFDSVLKADEQDIIREDIKKIIVTEYTLLSHSSPQRWIIQIPQLSEQINLDKIISRISELDHIKFVEPDHVLEKYPKNMN